MRVVVEPAAEDLIIVTIYNTSKMSKYWQEGSQV